MIQTLPGDEPRKSKNGSNFTSLEEIFKLWIFAPELRILSDIIIYLVFKYSRQSIG